MVLCGYDPGTKEVVTAEAGTIVNVYMALESCCQVCYIEDRKRESHKAALPQRKQLIFR